ncbi:MAG TPA: peptidoglycan DD-metalloendopeptidase family protein [Chitinophagales bacterium]|nr:peptidoglycan DD-metalloendopeptidase family protein [Chitinophagales bacterium]MCB0513366.1 peptidoglycan DD-metalloendopeptidase family protein [Bacteroidota bacterium]MCB9075787.1 peptidoglycan DD-metalloendopeptidase family protein [Chitinophagales bacterium]HMU97896.1 peptidoglycan DD-metalloendopeptidase family protein [Chitinophagales bacterium]HMV02722.1 peptidoglycan DD-metalloendopeptidase family protein [Chitinophagales bacterium]
MSRILIILSFLLINIFSINAQTNKEQLQKKREQLLKDIKYTQDLLKTKKSDKQASINDLNAINQQINLQQKLIQNSQSQVHLFDNQIIQSKEVIKTKTEELNQLKKEYEQAIINTYKYNKFTDKVLFILNAKSFSESLRRVNYLRRYAIHREKQAEEILQKSKEIQKDIVVINQKKAEKQTVLNQQMSEKQELGKTQQEKNKIVATLKSEEAKLQSTLSKKQLEAKKLDNQIAAIIKKEIEAAKKAALLAAQKAATEAATKKAAELAAKKAAEKEKTSTSTKTTTTTTKTTTSTTTTPVKPTYTPEYEKLTSSFYGNKGKLPWPVEKGFITKYFGKYNHPDLPGVLIENNGIDIKTDPSSGVRCIFEGTVVGIIDNPVFQNAVIISHGEYFTVYSKLGNVNVSKGQKVNTKQLIGTVYSDIDNVTEVHFEVWKGSEKLNPTTWIYSK